MGICFDWGFGMANNVGTASFYNCQLPLVSFKQHCSKCASQMTLFRLSFWGVIPSKSALHEHFWNECSTVFSGINLFTVFSGINPFTVFSGINLLLYYLEWIFYCILWNDSLTMLSGMNIFKENFMKLHWNHDEI